MHSSSTWPALEELGWTPRFHRQFLALIADSPELAGSVPARIVADHGSEFGLSGPHEPRRAVLAGRLLHELSARRPCIGDFVVAGSRDSPEPVRIEHVFERTSSFRRKASDGTSAPQAIAANVDLAIVVVALADERATRHVLARGLNPRRLERYLRAVADAPARALIAVAKADLRSDAGDHAAAIARDLGVEVVLTSAHGGLGIDELARRIERGTTAVLVGSSGSGKSSLTNCLLGRAAQRVEAMREADMRGRHTTTHRELFVLPNGGLLIDTPGMRELGLFADDATATTDTGFDDIDALAEACRFRDCRHESEPGCAVLAAVERGVIAGMRLEHAHKLRRELMYQKRRFDQAERQAARNRDRAHAKKVRALLRSKGRDD